MRGNGRPYSHRYDDSGYGGNNHYNNHTNDRQSNSNNYEGGRNNIRDDVMNFSLHYRH